MLPDISLLAATTTEAAANGSIGGLIFYITLALSISFLCSILEAVLLSTSLSHVELTAERGLRSGKLMKKHKEDVERPIAAILTLNTVAHTVGAAGAGAQAAAVFGSEWIGVISAVLTLLILVFSEIIPKTLGASYSKQLMPMTAYTIEFLVKVLLPIVWAFEKMTALLAPKDKEPTVTRSELVVLANVSTKEGALLEKESRILRNLLRLGKVQVGDIMTPRTVMFAFQKDMAVGEVMEKHLALPFSRIPIYGKSSDDVSGFILRYEILKAAAEDKDNKPLHELARDIHAVPETLSVEEVFEEFITQSQHVLLVLDEYGGTAGLITLEDAIEALLGAEIIDESDPVADMRELAKQRMQRYQSFVPSTPVTADNVGGTGKADITPPETSDEIDQLGEE